MSSTQLKHDPRALSRIYFSVAKGWWGLSLICRAIIVIVAAIGVWMPDLSKVVAVVMVALSIASEAIIYHSDKTKEIGEWLLRKLDLRDSFGWDISRDEMSDILARTSERIRADVRREGEEVAYFAGKDQHGPARALKNIQESAWWSKHLAATMSGYVLVFMLVAVLVSLFALLLTLSAVRNADTLSSIGRSVTSVLMVVLSLGLLRLTIGYLGFKEKAQRAERRAAELLRDHCNETEAIKLYAEYHIDRAAAPLVPDSVYRWNQKKLIALWEEYRTD